MKHEAWALILPANLQDSGSRASSGVSILRPTHPEAPKPRSPEPQDSASAVSRGPGSTG